MPMPHVLKALYDKAFPAREHTATAMLLMDCSGSMNRFRDIPRRAMDQCIEKLKEDPNNRGLDVCVWAFDKDVRVLVPLQPLMKTRKIKKYKNGRGTNLHGATADALEMLLAQYQGAAEQGRTIKIMLFVFTDGEDSSQPPGKHLPRLKGLMKKVKKYPFHDFLLIAAGIGVDGKEVRDELGFFKADECAMDINPSGVDLLQAAGSVSQQINTFTSRGISTKS